MQRKIAYKQQKANRDLLKFENKFANPFLMTNNTGELDHKSMAIANLLEEDKPIRPQKPNFCEIGKSSIFSRLHQFLPRFQEDTEDLLNDEERLAAARVDEAQLEPVKLADVLMPK